MKVARGRATRRAFLRANPFPRPLTSALRSREDARDSSRGARAGLSDDPRDRRRPQPAPIRERACAVLAPVVWLAALVDDHRHGTETVAAWIEPPA
jgi:hypothetical protein